MQKQLILGLFPKLKAINFLIRVEELKQVVTVVVAEGIVKDRVSKIVDLVICATGIMRVPALFHRANSLIYVQFVEVHILPSIVKMV